MFKTAHRRACPLSGNEIFPPVVGRLQLRVLAVLCITESIVQTGASLVPPSHALSQNIKSAPQICEGTGLYSDLMPTEYI